MYQKPYAPSLLYGFFFNMNQFQETCYFNALNRRPYQKTVLILFIFMKKKTESCAQMLCACFHVIHALRICVQGFHH